MGGQTSANEADRGQGVRALEIFFPTPVSGDKRVEAPGISGALIPVRSRKQGLNVRNIVKRNALAARIQRLDR
jgi:hypothetical protein